MTVHESPVFGLDQIAEAIHRAAVVVEMPNRAVIVRDEDGLVWSWSWLMRRFYGPEVATVEILSKYVGAHHVHFVLRDMLQLKVMQELDEVRKVFEEANVSCLQVNDVLDAVREIPREPREIEEFSESLEGMLAAELPKAINDLESRLDVVRGLMQRHFALSDDAASELLTADGRVLGHAWGLENVCGLYDQLE
jgi:hypothetical protein